MGLFGKHKEKTEELPKELPPKPEGEPLPPAPLGPSESIEVPGPLPEPPKPPGSLDDIKEEVTQKSARSEEMTPAPEQEAPVSETPEESSGLEDEFKVEGFDESLFDISDVHTQDSVSKEIPSGLGSSVQGKSVGHYDSDKALSFINNKSLRKPNLEESYFVTTQQFKAMLEIVDSVRKKVKDSSDIHLRLLDIKSEEDIEYENLRKNFQFVEDKLYEVDSLIFEK